MKVRIISFSFREYFKFVIFTLCRVLPLSFDTSSLLALYPLFSILSLYNWFRMDVAYLKENVGDVLAEGLSQVLIRQPEDSVEFLATWLLQYVDAKDKREQVRLLLSDFPFLFALYFIPFSYFYWPLSIPSLYHPHTFSLCQSLLT